MALTLRPSEIHYSQDSISCRFSQIDKRIGETLDELCEDRISVFDIKRISVAKVNGQWYTWDNRRLWVFRQLERLGKIETIPVRHSNPISEARLTTKCGGNYVVVRGNPGGFWHNQPSNSFKSSTNWWSPTDTYSSSRSSCRSQSAGESGDWWSQSAGESIDRWTLTDSSPVRPASTRSSSTRVPPADSPSSESSSIIDTLWSVAKIGLGIGALYLCSKLK